MANSARSSVRYVWSSLMPVNAFLSVVSALRILVFTVPSGSPVISAISECVSPSKNAISSVFRCSIGSWTITPRAFSIMLFRSASSARL